MRYYGGKEKLLDLIENGVKKTELNHGAKFVDLFSGTTTVAKHFKRQGFTVIANDFLEFSFALAKTYIETNEEPKFLKLRKHLAVPDLDNNYVINYLNSLPIKKGFIYNNYCPDGNGKRKYFSNENGQKIDAVREIIHEWKQNQLISELEYYYLITSLLEAVNLVSNVAGTYGAYLKTWDKRATKPLIITAPEIIHSSRKNKAFKSEANQLIKELKSIDILYLDPPYNSRQYASNYFLLELIAEGWFEDKKPIITGKTGVRDYKNQLSEYCYKGRASKALDELITQVNAKYILLSYNNEGIIPIGEIEQILSKKGKVSLFKKTHKRYKSINQDEDDPNITEERLHFVETQSAMKRANKLDGNSWLQNSFSIWRNVTKNQEETGLKHPAIFPIQLAEKIIDILTNGSGKNILDCFAGSGSTLIAGLKKNMNVFGVDISDEFKNLFFDRLSKEYSTYKQNGKIKYFVKDSREISKFIEANSIDLCLTSPPYWNILNAKRSADLKIGRNYTSDPNDIGNIEQYNAFLNELRIILSEVYTTIRVGGYCVINVMDIRKGSKLYPLHMDVVRVMEEIGFSFEDLLIWDRQKEYNNCKPLGYPYKFIINKVHEYILIFKKYGSNE
ncbi:MAG: DNA adenine methylase [Candidatus Paceibacterota bacterium]